MSDGPFCAHLHIDYMRSGSQSAGFFDGWRCRDCGTHFLPKPLTDIALTAAEDRVRDYESVVAGVLRDLSTVKLVDGDMTPDGLHRWAGHLEEAIQRERDAARGELEKAQTELGEQDAEIITLRSRCERMRRVLEEAGNHFDHDNATSAKDVLARYFSDSDRPSAPEPEREPRGCSRKRSDMTPCAVEDGNLAADDRGLCVGCGWASASVMPDPAPGSRGEG